MLKKLPPVRVLPVVNGEVVVRWTVAVAAIVEDDHIVDQVAWIDEFLEGWVWGPIRVPTQGIKICCVGGEAGRPFF